MTARYDAVSDSYARRPDEYDHPALEALLARLDGATGEALDLACGHGLVTRELARRGLSTVGIDISTSLVAHAVGHEVREPLGITYEVGDVSDARVLEGRTFDVVVCHFGLSDIDDLEGVMATVSAALRPGGRFVFSILHPCFIGTSDVSGSWPPETSYYDERWWRAEGELSTLRRVVGANHRMVSSYLNAVTDRGLSIRHIDEPPPEPDWTTTRPAAATQPVYLVVDCRKDDTLAQS